MSPQMDEKPAAYPPAVPKIPRMLHGGDYNPDQWMSTPEVWQEDVRLMKLAHCNLMSVGIFSWVSLEPEEGRYEFDWLDRIMDLLASNGIGVLLATPSGARPAWMSQKYPEVLRVMPDRRRILHGRRHNHCYTSPVYREKSVEMNRRLAERYRTHEALAGWHVSNEYGGECHCPLCQDAFRLWLRERYGSLESINEAWWTGFWSHRYTDWSQIESPSPIGETGVHGLNLDWKRFVTAQTVDFFLCESAPLRELTPETPVTTNFMGTYPGLDYWKLAPHLDFVSWDSYPLWHGLRGDRLLASDIAFLHDLNRSLKGGKPFLLLESTPSATNWQPVSKLKRPGMHLLSSLQAVAHGSDSVMYFQWRKSRGSSEKFHGAVVDHAGDGDSRVFRDVAHTGLALEKLATVVGATVRPEAAVLYDWENRWAIDDAQGPIKEGRDYDAVCRSFHRGLWKAGIAADVVDMDRDFSSYRLLIAPMLYMVRPGTAERIEEFVRRGGTFVATYWSGIVNESDLCFTTGFPGPLRKLLGIRSEEIDALYEGETNSVVRTDAAPSWLGGPYTAHTLCDLIHAESARVLAVYGEDFYAGRPALTVNTFGEGSAWYVASRNTEPFIDEFLRGIASELGLTPAVETPLPDGVSAVRRRNGATDFIFLMNFTSEPATVRSGIGDTVDLLEGSGGAATGADGEVTLAGYGVAVLAKEVSARTAEETGI